LPSILSGNDLIIFDPHGKYFVGYEGCQRGIRFSFSNEKHHELFFRKYKHQFLPYLNKPISDQDEIDLKKEFHGNYINRKLLDLIEGTV
jgi:hypothetical protein